MVEVKIKKTLNGATIPTRGSEYAAGYDLYCIKGDILPPHSTLKFDTGITMEIPKGYFGGIYARSGIATKKGLRPANAVGVVDSDYRGNIIVAIHNDTDIIQKIEDGERIAQLIIQPYLSIFFNETEELEDTKRGTGGFGSTGIK